MSIKVVNGEIHFIKVKFQIRDTNENFKETMTEEVVSSNTNNAMVEMTSRTSCPVMSVLDTTLGIGEILVEIGRVAQGLRNDLRYENFSIALIPGTLVISCSPFEQLREVLFCLEYRNRVWFRKLAETGNFFKILTPVARSLGRTRLCLRNLILQIENVSVILEDIHSLLGTENYATHVIEPRIAEGPDEAEVAGIDAEEIFQDGPFSEQERRTFIGGPHLRKFLRNVRNRVLNCLLCRRKRGQYDVASAPERLEMERMRATRHDVALVSEPNNVCKSRDELLSDDDTESNPVHGGPQGQDNLGMSLSPGATSIDSPEILSNDDESSADDNALSGQHPGTEDNLTMADDWIPNLTEFTRKLVEFLDSIFEEVQKMKTALIWKEEKESFAFQGMRSVREVLHKVRADLVEHLNIYSDLNQFHQRERNVQLVAILKSNEDCMKSLSKIHQMIDEEFKLLNDIWHTISKYCRKS